MGSLPDLTERAQPPQQRALAVRTKSDPNRDRTNFLHQIAVPRHYKKEWPWKKQSFRPGIGSTPRRKDSVASSVGAASVRRLINRPPQKIPPTIIKRFVLLCISSALLSTSLLPFTAYVGAESGALALTLMHSVSAVISPFTPHILQKTGVRFVISVGHVLVCVLLTAHIVNTPLPIVYTLYGLCGLTLAPVSLALSSSATTLSQAAGDEVQRKIALRRALRAIRATQDLGLVVGSLMMGGALMLWSENMDQLRVSSLNSTSDVWPPQEDFSEDDYEEQTCGSAGCPDTRILTTSALSMQGRIILLSVWALLAFASISLGVFGASSSPYPPPDTKSVLKDPKTMLGIPMGLFIGLQQGFMYTSYVKWYGVCVGGWYCAWRAICGAGVLQVIAAATFSMAAARGRRGALSAGGAAAHASLMLALLRWRAAKNDLGLPAVAAAAWGACAALWDVLQTGIGIGGSGWRGPWSVILSARHMGLAMACAARQYLCVKTQLAILAISLIVALISHTVLELKMRRSEPPRHRS